MFEPWGTFYLLIGTSAAALVGVMFIVITLSAEVAVEEINRGTVIYQNPTVFHLGAIVTISALASAPSHLAPAIAILLLVLAVLGVVYSALTTRRMFATYAFYAATLTDKLVFGLLPMLLYLLLGIGALISWTSPETAADAISAATVLLLVVAIRNAWDMATFTVRISRTLDSKQGREQAPK